MREKNPMVGLAGLVFEQADVDPHPGRAQPRDARARDERVRVADRDHHACEAGGDQRVAARRRAAAVRARLEADVGRRAAQ